MGTWKIKCERPFHVLVPDLGGDSAWFGLAVICSFSYGTA